MAKAKKETGFKFDSTYIDQRAIIIDKAGVPWLVDPEAGTIRLVKVIVDDKESAVVKKRRK